MKTALQLFDTLPRQWREEAIISCTDAELDTRHNDVIGAIFKLLINQNLPCWRERIIQYKEIIAFINWREPDNDADELFKKFKDSQQ